MQELRTARDEFARLLRHPTTEPTWQKFFSQNKFVLARGLPLRVLPCDVVPLGRPGKSEPDFLIYPGSERSIGAHGLVELKTHTSRVLRKARRNVLTLSADASTAVGQLRKYDQLFDNFAPKPRVLTLGSLSHLFVVMGLSDEIDAIDEELRRDLPNAIPEAIRFIGFDELLENFSRDVPKHFVLLEPAWPDYQVSELERYLSEPTHFEGVLHRVHSLPASFTVADYHLELSRMMSFSSRFPTPYRPSESGVIHCSESRLSAYTQLARSPERRMRGLTHVTLRFNGKIIDVISKVAPMGNQWSIGSLDFSAKLSQHAIELGAQAIRYPASHTSEKLVAVFDPDAVAISEVSTDIY